MVFVCGLVFGALPVWAYLSGLIDFHKDATEQWRKSALESINALNLQKELGKRYADEVNYWSQKYIQQTKVNK